MPRPTEEQIDTLLNFLEEHKDLAQGNLRSFDGRQKNHQLWEEICTTLNAMGKCSKTTKQWQKVWTDKKYFAKKAATAVRLSASSKGPSMAPALSQWDRRIISIMGEEYDGAQTWTRSKVFVKDPSEEHTSGSEESPQPEDRKPPVYNIIPVQNPIGDEQKNTTTRRRLRRPTSSILAGRSMQERLFRLEERRLAVDERRNEELAGIKSVLVELCGHMRQIKEKINK